MRTDGSTNPLLGARAVLFDLDGTLIASALDFPRMRAAVVALAREYGLPAAALTAPDALGLAHQAAAQTAEPERFLAAVEEALVAIELAALPTATLIPGARELLQALAERGIAVGIVTRNCRQAATGVLSRFALPHRLLLARGDVPAVKPDPIHLQLARDRLGVAPSEATMVGDHPMDIACGRAAGMRTVGYLGAERSPDVFAAQPPDATVRHLSEITAWICRS